MIRQKSFPAMALWITLAAMLSTMLISHHWNRSKPGERGVIKWDVISYYGYLPATFIYGDVKLGFIDDKEFVNENKFWYADLENGNRLIQTSMGLSFLYSPFFFMAHWLAPHFNQGQDGFSSIYQFFLVLSSLVYVMLGLILLRRILLRFFTPLATAITLVLVGLGTNLFFYTVHEGPMPHGYNFTLITLFLSLVIRWHDKPTIRKSIWLGLLYGLIVLIRPSNIIVGILFLGWGITGVQSLRSRPAFLVNHYVHLLLMPVMFLIPWIPQIIYWKTITGSFLFNSYGPSGSSFYFGSPHFFDVLFSFRKGWFLYTPVMLVATAGLFFLGRKFKGGLWPISLYLAFQVYLLASWWSWWSGGSFGLRSFVDLYGVMALPLAAFVETAIQARRWITYPVMGFLCFLLYMNQFQIYQYNEGYIHHSGMTQKAYFFSFLKSEPEGNYWLMLSLPDTQLARYGIYYAYYTGDDHSALKALDRDEGLEQIRGEIDADPKTRKEIGKHAKRAQITYHEALDMVVERVYDQKISR